VVISREEGDKGGIRGSTQHAIHKKTFDSTKGKPNTWPVEPYGRTGTMPILQSLIF